MDKEEIISDQKISEMSLVELNDFIKNASACHDGRYEQLDLCPSFDNKMHRDYLDVLAYRITLAYKQKISKELLLLSELDRKAVLSERISRNPDSEKSKVLLKHVIPSLEREFIMSKLKEARFFYHVKWSRFTREELNYLFLLHMQQG